MNAPRPPASHAAYAVAVSAAVLALVGALGLWAGQAWLFPSLGPTIFLQTVTPHEPGARAWNTVVGHAVGVAAGFGALYLLGAQHAPTPMGSGVLTASRVAATALAVGATIAMQSPLRALHPPAAATTMLVTLGGLAPGLHTVGLIAAGVVLVTLAGEGARRLHPLHRAPQAPRAGDPTRGADG